jgi:hypothetical protein
MFDIGALFDKLGQSSNFLLGSKLKRFMYLSNTNKRKQEPHCIYRATTHHSCVS